MGQGKTLFLTAMGAIAQIKQGRAIYANYHLKNLEYRLFNLEEFYKLFKGDYGELRDANLLLDEAYLFMDARASSSKINRLFNAFTFQTRKRNVNMYLATHNVNRLDKRTRSAIDFQGKCRFNKESKILTVRLKNLHNGRRRTMKFHGPTFYDYYDTEEVVVPEGKLFKLSESDVK